MTETTTRYGATRCVPGSGQAIAVCSETESELSSSGCSRVLRFDHTVQFLRMSSAGRALRARLNDMRTDFKPLDRSPTIAVSYASKAAENLTIGGHYQEHV